MSKMKVDMGKMVKREVVKTAPLSDNLEVITKEIHKPKKEKPVRLSVDITPAMYKQIKERILYSDRPTMTIRQYFTELAEASLKQQ